MTVQKDSNGEWLDLSEIEFKTLFETFLRTFVRVPGFKNEQGKKTQDWDDNVFKTFDYDSQDTTKPYYIQQLQKSVEEHSGVSKSIPFRISLMHIKETNVKLLRNILRYPADSIIFMDEVASEVAQKEYSNLQILKISIRVSLCHHPRVTWLRELDPNHIETLIALRGIVIRCSSVIPEMRVALFRCSSRNVPNQPSNMICGYEVSVYVTNGEVSEPLVCPRCQAKYSFELFHSCCVFGNKQLMKIQETLETVPEGETPQTVLAYVYDELVDNVKPGDFVEITGIYRASGVRVLPRTRLLRSIYRTYIDTNSIYKDRLNRYLVAKSDLEGPGADADLSELTESQIENIFGGESKTSIEPHMSLDLITEMKALGQDPQIYEKLVQSLAPNIWECDDTKKGLLCQLFGGTTKYVGGRALRSDIHILLCGDPSTAKSQLLHYVHGLAPRGVYTCGRGSSAVGLTAAMSRDPETREFVLESGAIVLSDRGICCIDEFDKMSDAARVVLHEVMEQQTVSIAKAGIVCSLNARTAILASANPISSRYDNRKSVVDNINLPPSLMSRFDLVYLMLDTPSSVVDKALASHLCQLYSIGAEEQIKPPPLSRQTMAQYISFSRQFCKPKLSAEAGATLVEFYVELRQRGNDVFQKSLSATTRQLESLIRLSEALAKMELADYVETRHVKEALRLMQIATYSALIDPATGRLDFDQLNAGISGESRLRRQRIESAILECIQSVSGGMQRAELTEKVAEKLKQNFQYTLDQSGRELNLLLRELEDFGTIGRANQGKIISLVGT